MKTVKKLFCALLDILFCDISYVCPSESFEKYRIHQIFLSGVQESLAHTSFSLQLVSVAARAILCLSWVESFKTSFHATRKLINSCSISQLQGTATVSLKMQKYIKYLHSLVADIPKFCLMYNMINFDPSGKLSGSV